MSSGEKSAVLLGFGSVGQHLLQLLLTASSQRPRPPIQVKAIADSSGGVFCPMGLPLEAVLSWKQAGKSLGTFVSKNCDIHHHTDSLSMLKAVAQVGDIVLDATPVNLSDGGVGLACCRWASQHGMHLVLANKAPLVLAYQELMHYSQQHPNSRLEFSATVCGGLPVINVGKRDLSSSARLDMVQGIFNSTSNYILSRMASGEHPETALAHARAVGIAEADASLDLQGFDTANKLVIICNAVLDCPASLQDVELQGMTNITADDVQIAAKDNQVYRLIATAERVHTECALHIQGKTAPDVKSYAKLQCSCFKLTVRPTLVPADSFFGQCLDTDMSVVFVSDEFETISMKTNEKGVNPTAAAMLRDCRSILSN